MSTVFVIGSASGTAGQARWSVLEGPGCHFGTGGEEGLPASLFHIGKCCWHRTQAKRHWPVTTVCYSWRTGQTFAAILDIATLADGHTELRAPAPASAHLHSRPEQIVFSRGGLHRPRHSSGGKSPSATSSTSLTMRSAMTTLKHNVTTLLLGRYCTTGQ